MNTDETRQWFMVFMIAVIALLAFGVGGHIWAGVMWSTHGMCTLFEHPSSRNPSAPTAFSGLLAIVFSACGW